MFQLIGTLINSFNKTQLPPTKAGENPFENGVLSHGKAQTTGIRKVKTLKQWSEFHKPFL